MGEKCESRQNSRREMGQKWEPIRNSNETIQDMSFFDEKREKTGKKNWKTGEKTQKKQEKKKKLQEIQKRGFDDVPGNAENRN